MKKLRVLRRGNKLPELVTDWRTLTKEERRRFDCREGETESCQVIARVGPGPEMYANAERLAECWNALADVRRIGEDAVAHLISAARADLEVFQAVLDSGYAGNRGLIELRMAATRTVLTAFDPSYGRSTLSPRE